MAAVKAAVASQYRHGVSAFDGSQTRRERAKQEKE